MSEERSGGLERAVPAVTEGDREPDADGPGLPEHAAGPDDIADGREHALDPAAVQVARITGYVVLASVCVPGPIAVAAMVAFADFPRAVDNGLVAALLLVVVVGSAVAHWWPPVRHRHIRYRVDAAGLTIWQGVMWRSVTSVPKTRVQHTDVSQGPLQRRYGLATLIVHTAGTQDASVSLSGLARDTALRIRDFLVDAGSGE